MVWIVIFIGLLLGIVIEPMCDATQDTLDHHQGTSIFSNKDFRVFGWKPFKNQLWWNSNQGWRNKYVDRDQKKGRVKWNILGFSMNKPVQITDGWHFFKTLKIVSHQLAMAIFPCTFLLFDDRVAYSILIGFGVVLFNGSVRNTVFSLFYKKILIKKAGK